MGWSSDEHNTQTEIMKYKPSRYPELVKNGVEGKIILEFVVEKMVRLVELKY